MLRHHRFVIGAFLVSTLPAISGQASAAMMCWEFAGVIHEVYDPADFLGGDIQVGESFAGYYVFDSTTSDSYIGNTQEGKYVSSLASMNVVVENYTFFAEGTNCQITVDDYDVDRFQLIAHGFGIDGLTVDLMSICLITENNSILNGDHLPIWPIEFNDFEFSTFGIKGRTQLQEFVKVSGHLTSLQLVPEPSSLALLCAIVFLAVRDRPRKSFMK